VPVKKSAVACSGNCTVKEAASVATIFPSKRSATVAGWGSQTRLAPPVRVWIARKPARPGFESA
jgi:hypothetical protein